MRPGNFNFGQLETQYLFDSRAIQAIPSLLVPIDAIAWLDQPIKWLRLRIPGRIIIDWLSTFDKESVVSSGQKIGPTFTAACHCNFYQWSVGTSKVVKLCDILGWYSVQTRTPEGEAFVALSPWHSSISRVLSITFLVKTRTRQGHIDILILYGDLPLALSL